MNKLTLAFCALFLFSAPLVWGEPHGGSGGGGGGFEGGSGSGGGSGFSGGSDFHTSNSVSPQFRSMGVRTVPHYTNSSRLFNSSVRPSLGVPVYGPHGGSFRASMVSPRAMSSSLVRNNMSLVNSGGFRGQIGYYNAHENVVGHYYWHNYNGNNFCHYYDRWGCNWYGWNCGSSFYWSCWWGNYWWWYDPAYYRWCYWYDGWWWWQNPADVTVTYVYNNGQYIPDQSANVQGAQQQGAQDNSAQSQSAPAPDSSYSSVPPEEETSAAVPTVEPLSIITFRSKDGSRMVKLAGNDAFLYDTTATPAFRSKYVASNVTAVRFSKASDGSLQITLVLKDGSTQLYDADGNTVAND